MRKLLLIPVLLGGIGQAVEIPLPQGPQPFTFKISSASIDCREGFDHPHFPTPTVLTISTHRGSSAITYPSRLVLLNTNQVSAHVMGKTCQDFANILDEPAHQLISGKGQQTYSSFVGKNVRGDCLASLREETTLEIGGHRFTGTGSFVVNALPPEACEGNP